MGNCLRVLEIIRAATASSDQEDDAALLDPGNYGENLQIPAATESSESDESPLLFRMLNRSSRRRNNAARRSRSATYHADTGRITGGDTTSENNNSSRSTRRSRRNRANTSHPVSLQTGGASQLSNVEAGQILLVQRLGLIQHLPLIVWEGNRKNKDKLKTGNGENENGENKNDDFQTDTSNSTHEAQNQSSPINTASSNSNAEHLKNTENTQSTSDNATFETEQPPSYEKSNILPTSFNQTTSSSNRNEILPDSSSSDKDDNECTICMEDFEEGNHIRYLPCMHFYHQACIDSWLMRSFTCPRCMEAVDSGIMASFAQQLS